MQRKAGARKLTGEADVALEDPRLQATPMYYSRRTEACRSCDRRLSNGNQRNPPHLLFPDVCACSP